MGRFSWLIRIYRYNDTIITFWDSSDKMKILDHTKEIANTLLDWQQWRLQRDAKLRLFQQMHQDYEPEWRRASGGCVCEICGLKYRDHFDDTDGFDKRLCNGDVVHL